MKRKPQKIIKQDTSLLIRFIAFYPEAKSLLCTEFNYATTATIDRWWNRGFPSRFREPITNYINSMLEPKKIQKQRSRLIHERLSKVWA